MIKNVYFLIKLLKTSILCKKKSYFCNQFEINAMTFTIKSKHLR